MPERMTDDSVFSTDVPSEIEPVRKSIRVKASPEKAFRIFTQEMDTWWPRTHHIGNSPMKRVVVEGKPGGRIYTEQEDGTVCPWASVRTWAPPNLFVMVWQVSPEWQYEPNIERCSEVEVRFTPVDDGTTLVELEHRGIQRHAGACAAMREQVNAEGGWGSLLGMFAKKAGGVA